MNKFDEAGLNHKILVAIEELGFATPTPIQQKTIPHLLKSQDDLIALAQTGTGKTAAFSLPVIHQLDTTSNDIQAIVLSPTRELAIQITRDMEDYTKYMKEVYITAVYGGDSIERQIRSLRSGTHIVVGTPGRVVDLIKRRVLKLEKIKWLVLDEADEMLKMGFKEDIETILGETPKERQTLLFSATLPYEINQIAKKYMRNPQEIAVAGRNSSAENVDHLVYVCAPNRRFQALKRIIDATPEMYGIIFCRTRRETGEIADMLVQDKYAAEALHGDMTQAQRDHVMRRFRKGTMKLLVATDVAARGIDVQDLTHVVNYKMPDNLEVYIHRSGRTGRAGKEGLSVAIVAPREMNQVRLVERKIGKKFIPKEIPSGQEILRHRMFGYIERVSAAEVDEMDLADFMEEVNEKFADLDRDAIVQKFLALEFSRYSKAYKNAPDLNVSGREPAGNRGGSGLMFSRFYINLGSKNSLNPPKLIELINRQQGVNGVKVGKIEILKKISFFEIDSTYEKELLNAFANVDHDGVKVVVERTKSAPRADSPKPFGKRKFNRNSNENRFGKKRHSRGGGGSFRKRK
ncbi:MAG TPA: DEAD/DEAH box helicase [Bacteroidetes bacterium]|nr:DEAD/DEAH box helicase [Bacteroidota bacterium]